MPRRVPVLLFRLKTSVPTKILTRFTWPPSTSSTWSEGKWSGGSTGAFSGFTGAVIAGCSSGGNKSSLFSKRSGSRWQVSALLLDPHGEEGWTGTASFYVLRTMKRSSWEQSHVTNVCLHRRRWLNLENLRRFPLKITNWLPSFSTWSFTSASTHLARDHFSDHRLRHRILMKLSRRDH